MSKLKDRINNISEFFRGMEIMNDTIIVRVQYGRKWGAYPSEDGQIKVAKSEETMDEWFYYADSDAVEMDEVFDLIDETIQMNKNTLAKVNLLKEKIEELKSLFENERLERLETLQFVLQDKPKEKRKYTKRKKEINEGIIEEHEENEVLEETIELNTVE